MFKREKYTCSNCGLVLKRKKDIKRFQDGTYGYGYFDWAFCPRCGTLMPYSLEKIRAFFDVFKLHPDLKNAQNLIYKSEFTAAAREACIVVENNLRKKSQLDTHGFDLATKALSFEIDRKTGEVTKAPLIAVNNLKTESDRNEQEGLRYMLMGFFQGPRNVYQHNHIGSGATNAISVLIEASFFLRLLDGQSIPQNGHWIRFEPDYQEIINKMPRGLDRWKLKRMLKRSIRQTDGKVTKNKSI